MVVLIIVAVLSAMATVMLRGTSYAGTPNGFAEELAAEIEAASRAAIATRRPHAIQLTTDVSGQHLIVWRAKSEGLGSPAINTTNFDQVRVLNPPRDVTIDAVVGSTTITTGGHPGSGFGVPCAMMFQPDGSAQALTFYITDLKGTRKARVAVYAVTAMTYVLNDW